MDDEGDGRPSLAVAMPAFCEADGIGGFVVELDAALAPLVSSLVFVVVDDASPDGTLAALKGVEGDLHGDLRLVAQAVNRGHGPTVLRAYHEALSTGADLVLQVDGDGHFSGEDVARLVRAWTSATVVTGVRRNRFDAWYRKVLTRATGHYLRALSGVRARDPNCPLRLYRAPALQRLLAVLPDDLLIPNLYLSVLADRMAMSRTEVVVAQGPRRGSGSEGTMWGRTSRILIPRRLIRFAGGALRESIGLRSQLRSASPTTDRLERP